MKEIKLEGKSINKVINIIDENLKKGIKTNRKLKRRKLSKLIFDNIGKILGAACIGFAGLSALLKCEDYYECLLEIEEKANKISKTGNILDKVINDSNKKKDEVIKELYLNLNKSLC